MPDQHHRSILRPRSALSLAAIAVLVAILAGALTLAGIAPWSPPRTLESFRIGYSAKQGEEVFILPPVTREWDSSLHDARYLILGVRADGAMTVWLSNAPRESSRLDGRILEEITQAQGEEIAEEDVHP